MTEITRVPLQPIAKGALTRLWLGVAASVVLAGGIAWAAMPPMVKVEVLKKGEGPGPTAADVAIINYKGMLKDGTVFDEAQQAPLPLAGVIPGFTKALMQTQQGGKYHIVIPASLAYKDKQAGPIPPNSDLTFDIEVLGFMNAQEFQQRQALMEQLRSMQGQGKGGPGAGPGGAPEGPPPGAEGMPGGEGAPPPGN